MTPTYQGSGQTQVQGFWSGLGLGSWFGVETPAYAGEGQPTAGASCCFGGSTPIYLTGPSPRPYAGRRAITVLVPEDLIPQP